MPPGHHCFASPGRAVQRPRRFARARKKLSSFTASVAQVQHVAVEHVGQQRGLAPSRAATPAPLFA